MSKIMDGIALIKEGFKEEFDLSPTLSIHLHNTGQEIDKEKAAHTVGKLAAEMEVDFKVCKSGITHWATLTDYDNDVHVSAFYYGPDEDDGQEV